MVIFRSRFVVVLVSGDFNLFCLGGEGCLREYFFFNEFIYSLCLWIVYYRFFFFKVKIFFFYFNGEVEV